MTVRAVIVAHGQPSQPAPPEAALAALAAQVAALVPDIAVASATLAMPGALEAACTGAPAPILYPLFMAEGYFTRRTIPRRLAAAGLDRVRVLPPFGADPAMAALVAAAAGHADRVLLAGHGSGVSRTSHLTCEAAAEALRAGGRTVLTGYVEQAPFLAGAARALGSGVCLPFFAMRAGHVLDDLPAALAEAHFNGPLLDPIGRHPGAPALIAAALRAAA